MSEDESNNSEEQQSQNSQSREEALGGSTKKGYSGDEDEGSEGGYGFIRPSAESEDSDGSNSE
jgi:hypothetical protein